MELDVLVNLYSRGILGPGEAYTVENVSGKLIANKDDRLTYRIKFSPRFHVAKKDEGSVRIAPSQAVDEFRRRGGRAECGFYFRMPDETFDAPFFCCPAGGYSAVLSEDRQSIAAIYFVLEDVNLDPDVKSRPKWRLQPDSSALLESFLGKNRWTSLPPVHPDPAVDPGVPIQQRPQGDPRWYYYRNDCSRYDLFKGKVSGTRAWKFIGGSNDFLKEADFKGNNLTRCGRMTEPKMALALLLHDPANRLYETGSHPHPTIPDVCAAPDAIIHRPTLSFETLRDWHKMLIKAAIANKIVPSDTMETVDFSKGVFESKVMFKLDAKKVGPVMRPEYLVQVYMEMICTNTYWGFVQRCCLETEECRLYRVLRRPKLAYALERCIIRMRKEMVGGTPYTVAVEHESNKDLVNEFRKLATWYNDAEKKQYTIIPWPRDPIAEFDKLLWKPDTFAGLPDTIATKTVATEIAERGSAVIPVVGGGAKRGKKKGAAQPKRVREPIVAAEPPPLVDPTDGMELWKNIAYINGELLRCVGNGDWDHALVEGAIKSQILNYIDLEKLVVVQSIKSARKKHRPLILEADLIFTGIPTEDELAESDDANAAPIQPPHPPPPSIPKAADDDDDDHEY